MLLRALPDSWETFRTLLSNYAPNGVIFMDFAKSSFLNKDMRTKTQGSSLSDVLISGPRVRKKTRRSFIENKIGENPEADLRILSAIIVV